jgi:hypothetical protein
VPPVATIPAVVLSLALVTLLAYSAVLDYFFTGIDTVTLIDTGRIDSPSDLTRILTTPLMDGTRFTDILLYYRPLTSLSYGLDYALWDLNPIGYHAVDLALHALAAVLVFLLVMALTDENRLTAWLSALLFAAHPIHVDVVPVVSNRQDVLSTVFLLASMTAFIKHRRGPSGRGYLLYLSLILYVLALGSKELAVVLPLLVLSYALLTGRHRTAIGKTIEALRAVLGFVLITMVWFAWRAFVLGGAGGYVGSRAGAAPVTGDPGHDLLNYLFDLVYPTANIIARSVPVYALLTLAILFVIALAFSGRKRAAKAGEITDGEGRVLAWLACWLALPLCVSLWTGTFSHRTMYFPSAALCILLSVTIVRGGRTLYAISRSAKSLRGKDRLWQTATNGFSLTIAASLAALLLVFSPTFRGCSDWEVPSNAAFLLLTHLELVANDFDKGTRLEFKDLPVRATLEKYSKPRDRFWFHQARQMGVLSVWSINSWLNLTHPTKDLEAAVLSRAVTRYMPVKIEFEISVSQDRKLVRIRPVYHVLMPRSK